MSSQMDALHARFGNLLYRDSINETEHGVVAMVRQADEDVLVTSDETLGFQGTFEDGWLCCRPTHENAACLRAAFPFTAPSRVLRRDKTMGVGDRLGICTPGHIRAFRAYPDLTPVFAQQSIRELTLTNRSFDDVLDCATYAVYREGFKTGYGADGDHLKTPAEVDYALDRGYTMITLDCSEYIHNDVTAENYGARYVADPVLEALYLGKTFDVGEGYTITFDEASYKQTALIYGDAVRFAASIYHDKIESEHGDVADFEMSIDETLTPTTPAQHFFVASELRRLGVDPATIAPRFCGEFQKGIDYKGDLVQFEAELKVHAAIARHFGYKLSVHSGSDKFSVFPFVGRETQGRFHVKTAGTNWLQAMLLIATVDPALYRDVHAYALQTFDQARAYYHVTTDLTKIPALDDLPDAALPALFQNEDARQLIHITYGLILNNADLHARLYKAWRAHEDDLETLVDQHIERHMRALLDA